MANNLFRTDLEDLAVDIHELYCSEAVDFEVITQTEIGLAFIKIEDYLTKLEKHNKELEATIEQLKNQIK
jgi:formiminotetrahydrofolate cyclodeaminase